MPVILPMRRGYAESTGEKVKIQNCNLTEYGIENAKDIQEVVSWLLAQEKFKNRKIILVGQSTGGLAVMAYSSFPDNHASAILNFHGGMRPEGPNDCKWQARIDAFNTYAKTSTPVSYWFYTENDHSSNSAYISRLFQSFLNAGGKVWLGQFGKFKNDGHYLFGDKDGGEIWQPKALNYLTKLGLIPPTAEEAKP